MPSKVWCKSARHAAERSGGIRFAQDKCTRNVRPIHGDTFHKGERIVVGYEKAESKPGFINPRDSDGMMIVPVMGNALDVVTWKGQEGPDAGTKRVGNAYVPTPVKAPKPSLPPTGKATAWPTKKPRTFVVEVKGRK